MGLAAKGKSTSWFVLLLIVTVAGTTSAWSQTSVIARENAKAGDASWVLTKPNPYNNHSVEGYAAATSVDRGAAVQLYISSQSQSVSIDVYRMGWYGGLGARKMRKAVSVKTVVQAIPAPNAVTGLVEANWRATYNLPIPTSTTDPTQWCSGVYLVKLTNTGVSFKGYQSYIVFTVKDGRASDILFQNAVTTYQAYNNWGGKSLYANNSVAGNPARKVSFLRPYTSGNGAGHFLYWEYPMVRFLEREGFDVTYATSVDTQVAPTNLLNHKMFLSAGHDEYWSWQMRDAVDDARNAGINLAFLGADTAAEQIRWEASAAKGIPNATIVGYKEFAMKEDPYALDSDPTNDKYITTEFRDRGRPEEQTVGTSVLAATPHFKETDVVLSDTSSFLFTNTGLHDGDVIPGILGNEIDRVSRLSPVGIHVVANTPVMLDTGVRQYAQMAWFTSRNGGMTFSGGTIQFTWALDDYSWWGHPSVRNPAMEQVARNLLNSFTGH